MKFIEVTSIYDGSKILVNASQIKYVQDCSKTSDPTMIFFDRQAEFVRAHPDVEYEDWVYEEWSLGIVESYKQFRALITDTQPT